MYDTLKKKFNAEKKTVRYQILELLISYANTSVNIQKIEEKKSKNIQMNEWLCSLSAPILIANEFFAKLFFDLCSFGTVY